MGSLTHSNCAYFWYYGGMELNKELFSGLVEADPRRLSREMSGLLSVEAIKDGDNPPVLLYRAGGKQYVVEVRLWDVTSVPFYKRQGLVERLNDLRKVAGGAIQSLLSGEKPRSQKAFEAAIELESRPLRRAPKNPAKS